MTEASGREDIRLREVTWCTVWRSNTRLAQRFRDGRVFLAGDAAHVCPPTGGQGMNTGIQDSHNLGWKLAAVLSGAPATVLDSYQIERRRTAEAALAVSAALLAKHQRGDDDAYRRDGAVHQLGLNYRGGPLSEEDSSAPGPLVAGDRAPDAPCRYPDGTPISLFELFRGPHWTLLGFGADRSATVSELAAHCDGRVHGHTIVQLDEPATTGTIVDAHGHARRGYGVASSTLALVRPDGYLGLIGGPDPTERVTRYLARVGALRRDVDRSRTPEDLPHSTD